MQLVSGAKRSRGGGGRGSRGSRLDCVLAQLTCTQEPSLLRDGAAITGAARSRETVGDARGVEGLLPVVSRQRMGGR